MIWQPKPNQRVRIHYRKSAQNKMPCQGIKGTVMFGAKGPGPMNACIECSDGQDLKWFECVPRGNLILETITGG